MDSSNSRSIINEIALKKIIQYIKQNNLRPGDKLPTEREMTKYFEVSRVCLREALKILQYQQVLRIKQGSGIFIQNLDPIENVLLPYSSGLDDKEAILRRLHDLVQARIMLETFACIEFSKIATPEQIQLLYGKELYEYELLNSGEEFNNKNGIKILGFEQTIIELLGNNHLISFHRILHSTWANLFNDIGAFPSIPDIRHKDHMTIIRAIQNQSSERIRNAVYSHLKRTEDAVTGLFQ